MNRSSARRKLLYVVSFLLAAALSAGLYSPTPYAATDVTLYTDTGWRFVPDTYNFDDGLIFSFSDAVRGGLPVGNTGNAATPFQTINALGTLTIGMTRDTSVMAAYTTGAYVGRYAPTDPQQCLLVTVQELHRTSTYTGTGALQSVAGLYMNGSSMGTPVYYDPIAPRTVARFDNANTYLSAEIAPGTSVANGFLFAATGLTNGAEAIFNGNAYLDLALGANADTQSSVLSIECSHAEFNGAKTVLTGISDSTYHNGDTNIPLRGASTQPRDFRNAYL